MGMYGTVLDEEVKLTGLFASVAYDLNLVRDSHCALNAADVYEIVRRMRRAFKDGSAMERYVYGTQDELAAQSPLTNMQSIWHFEHDVHVFALLAQWLAMPHMRKGVHTLRFS
jgi:uncharacterized protein with von Willebrand factor type A (vWA) domain